ncbi:MAG: metallophosphoesterase [bacterium]
MKKIIYSILSIIFIAAIALAAIRWNVWFGNRPEAQYTISQSITNVQLSFGETANELFVSWRGKPDSTLLEADAVKLIFERIDEERKVFIEDEGVSDFGGYGDFRDFRDFRDSKNSVDCRNARESEGVGDCGDKVSNISNKELINNKIESRILTTSGGSATYFWGKTQLEAGRYRYAIVAPDTISEWYETTVKDNYDEEFTALILGDIQDKRATGTDTLIAELASRYSPDFILQLGDLIERPHQNFWQLYFDAFAPFCTTTPMIAVAGNHEYIKGWNKHIEERFFYTFPYFLSNNPLYNHELKHNPGSDPNSIIPSAATYKYDFGNVSLILLDSNQPLLKLWQQRKWLRNALQERTDKQYRIVAFHHPMHSAKGYFNNLFVRLFFRNIINDGNAQLVLSGHEHTLTHLTPEEKNNKYHQIISHFSAKDYSKAKGIPDRHYIIMQYNDKKMTLAIKNLKHETIKTISL